MSRTYRRKSGEEPWWLLSEWVNCFTPSGNYSHVVRIKTDPKSKEVIKEMAKYHSDSFHKKSWQWPGWAIAEFIQRPYRRKAKREILKFLDDPDYEVILRPVPRKGYWD